MVGVHCAWRLHPCVLGGATDPGRHKDIPHDLTVPYLQFTQDDFEAALPNIPVGGVASHEYTQEEAKKAIEANMNQQKTAEASTKQ